MRFCCHFNWEFLAPKVLYTGVYGLYKISVCEYQYMRVTAKEAKWIGV